MKRLNLNELRLVRARWAWCPIGGGIDNGAVAVGLDGRIVDAGRFEDLRINFGSARIMDVGDAVLVPPFINAHYNLEYAALRGGMPRGGDFVQWLSRIVMVKMTMSKSEAAAAIPAAIGEMKSSGVLAIGEICSSDRAVDSLARGGIEGRLYAELICPSSHGSAERLSEFEALWDSLENRGRFALGISPHAPYSITESAWEYVQKFRRRNSKANDRLLHQSIHCSETRDEIDLILKGEGKLLEFLQSAGVLDSDWRPPRCTPVQYLAELGALDSDTLLVHCNYLDPPDAPRGRDSDVALIREHGCSVVVCPGSHRWFDHAAHPLQRLLDAGVTVCLGTDSLASNDSLSMLREIALAARMMPGLAVSDLLRMVTQNAAQALDLEPGWGSLRPGAQGPPVALSADKSCKSIDDLDPAALRIVPLDEPGAGA